MAKAGARKDPVIRKTVSDLLDAGLSPKQIAEKLGYSQQRIYTLRRELLDQVETATEREAGAA